MVVIVVSYTIVKDIKNWNWLVFFFSCLIVEHQMSHWWEKTYFIKIQHMWMFWINMSLRTTWHWEGNTIIMLGCTWCEFLTKQKISFYSHSICLNPMQQNTICISWRLPLWTKHSKHLTCFHHKQYNTTTILLWSRLELHDSSCVDNSTNQSLF
jgi:hypothetical protein